MFQEEQLLVLDEKFEFELAELGDLSKYSFDELSNLLNNFTCTVNSSFDYFVAFFESKYSTIEIKYTNKGKFIKILDQYWKELLFIIC